MMKKTVKKTHVNDYFMLSKSSFFYSSLYFINLSVLFLFEFEIKDYLKNKNNKES